MNCETNCISIEREKRSTASIAIYLDLGNATTSLEREQEVWASLLDYLRVLTDNGIDVTSYEIEVDRTDDNELSTTDSWTGGWASNE